MPPKAPVTPGEKAAAKWLQKKVEMASAHSAQAATPSEIETSESIGRPICQAKEVAMKNQDKPATRKRAASSIADAGKGKQKKLTATSIKKQIMPPEESNHGTARPPCLCKFLLSHDDALQSKKPKQLKDLFYDETPHFITNTFKAALKPTTHEFFVVFLGIIVTIYLDSSKPSGSYTTSMIPTSDSDDDQATSTSQTTKAVTSKTKFNDVPITKKRAKKTVHKAVETLHFTVALSTSSIPDSLTCNSTRLKDTWSLLTHLVWNGNNTINLLSQQPHIQHLEQDQAYMKAFTRVPDGCIGLICKKLKEISDCVIPGAYGVKTGDDKKINCLLNLLTFIYKFDTKGNPILSQPFDHPAINTVCQLAFFTSQDQVGVKYKDQFVSVLDDNDELEIPSAMVSAVVTVIFSSLLDLKSIVDVGHKHGDFGQSLISGAAMVWFGLVQRVLDKNQEPDHGLVLQNLRTPNQTTENHSLWSGSVFFWSKLEPNLKIFSVAEDADMLGGT
ncbi:hypothetical protein BDR06DRAFT_977018 [Suillus hirtellus]|nr:hypothetical protein BDR06DRAFT_977018 [Suillus hirtellus]